MLALLHRNANGWFELALGRAPVELQSTLQVAPISHCSEHSYQYLPQKYLAIKQGYSGVGSTDLGASVAEDFGKAVGPVERQLSMKMLIH